MDIPLGKQPFHYVTLGLETHFSVDQGPTFSPLSFTYVPVAQK